jgi:hypothetical protein
MARRSVVLGAVGGSPGGLNRTVKPQAQPRRLTVPGAPMGVLPQPFAPASPFIDQNAPAAAAPAAPAAPRDYAAEAAANPDVWKDSTYNTALANLLNQKVQGESQIETAGRRAVQDRDQNLGLLAEGRGKAKTQTTQSANNRGLFYSGILGKQLGDVDTDYGRREGDVNQSFTRGEEERATSRSSLLSGFDQAQREAAAQAVDRWVAAAQGTEDQSTPSLDAYLAALNRWNVGTNARGR